MKDSKANIVKTSSKRLDDYPILLAECEAVRQAAMLAAKYAYS